MALVGESQKTIPTKAAIMISIMTKRTFGEAKRRDIRASKASTNFQSSQARDAGGSGPEHSFPIYISELD